MFGTIARYGFRTVLAIFAMVLIAVTVSPAHISIGFVLVLMVLGVAFGLTDYWLNTVNREHTDEVDSP